MHRDTLDKPVVIVYSGFGGLAKEIKLHMSTVVTVKYNVQQYWLAQSVELIYTFHSALCKKMYANSIRMLKTKLLWIKKTCHTRVHLTMNKRA